MLPDATAVIWLSNSSSCKLALAIPARLYFKDIFDFIIHTNPWLMRIKIKFKNKTIMLIALKLVWKSCNCLSRRNRAIVIYSSLNRRRRFIISLCAYVPFLNILLLFCYYSHVCFPYERYIMCDPCHGRHTSCMGFPFPAGCSLYSMVPSLYFEAECP